MAERVLHKDILRPMIYSYSDELHPGCIKIGYTTMDVEKRVAQQYQTKSSDLAIPYKIILCKSAVLSNGMVFNDNDVCKILKKMGIRILDGGWLKCTADDVNRAIETIKSELDNSNTEGV